MELHHHPAACAQHRLFNYEERATASCDRKIREIFLAAILTRQRSKQDILQMYGTRFTTATRPMALRQRPKPTGVTAALNSGLSRGGVPGRPTAGPGGTEPIFISKQPGAGKVSSWT